LTTTIRVKQSTRDLLTPVAHGERRHRQRVKIIDPDASSLGDGRAFEIASLGVDS
jgi:hypothetical protein